MNKEICDSILKANDNFINLNKDHLTEPKKEDYMMTDEYGKEVFDSDTYDADYQKYLNVKNVLEDNRILVEDCYEFLTEEKEKEQDRLANN